MAATVDLIARLKTEGAGGFKNDMGGVGGAVSGAASRINSSFQTIVKAGAAAFAALGVASIAAGAQLISLGSEAEEMQGKFDVVFATFGGQVSDNLDRFAGEVGRSKFELRGFASILGDTLKPMGFTEESAAGLSEELVKLAVDLGSFNNMETDQALQRLQSTLIGNHGNALAFGVIINENTLSAELLRMGVEDLTGAELEQAKVQARINLLMAGTTDAQGDAERTSESWANQQRRLNSILSDAGTEMGLKLLPVVTPLLAILGDMATGAVPWLSQAFESFLSPLETVSDIMQRFFSRLDLGLSPTRALVGALNQAGFRDIGEKVQFLSDKFFEMKDIVTEFLQPIIDFVAENVKLQDILVVLGIAVATVVIPALLGLVGTFLAFIAPVLAVIAVVALLRTAWENDWGGIQGKTAEAIEFVKGFISDGLAAISAWWDEHGETVIAMATTLWEGIQEKVSEAIEFVKGFVSDGLTAIYEFWQTHGDGILEAASKAWEAIKEAVQLVTGIILGLVSAFFSLVSGDFETAKETFTTVMSTAWEQIKDIFTNGIEGAKQIFNNTDWGAIGTSIMQGIANGITAGLGMLRDAAAGAAQAALDAAKGLLGIQSPSKAFYELGEWTTEGFADALFDGQRMVEGAMSSMMQIPVAPQMAFTNDTSASMGFGGGGFGGGMTINVYIDGGTSDMQNSARTGVGAALKEAGLNADIRRRI